MNQEWMILSIKSFNKGGHLQMKQEEVAKKFQHRINLNHWYNP